MKAVNIKWDASEQEAENLPKEIEIPAWMTEEEVISEYITERTGFCHFGFALNDDSEEDEATQEREITRLVIDLAFPEAFALVEPKPEKYGFSDITLLRFLRRKRLFPEFETPARPLKLPGITDICYGKEPSELEKGVLAVKQELLGKAKPMLLSQHYIDYVALYQSLKKAAAAFATAHPELTICEAWEYDLAKEISVYEREGRPYMHAAIAAYGDRVFAPLKVKNIKDRLIKGEFRLRTRDFATKKEARDVFQKLCRSSSDFLQLYDIDLSITAREIP